MPKTIAIMLDLDGTCDFIDDEKTKIFMTQLDILRKKFEAELATISISTHNYSSENMREVLGILSHNLSDYIKIGINFFYGGIYDYDKKKEVIKGYNFNQDKVKTFDRYYVSDIEMNNQWFAIIDDSILDDTYSKYKDNHPMLVCRPSQDDEDNLTRNSFMSISTTTKGFDGVIEVLNLYIESIRSLSPAQILEVQRNMMTHLSSWDLIQKVRERDYVFLTRYFREGFADKDDYDDLLRYLIYTNREQMPSKDELLLLQEMFVLISEYFQKNNEEENIKKVLKLQRMIEMRK